VRASLAVPGIFAPRVIGERTLVDGAVTDKVPVAVLQALGIHPIVAVDVSHPLRPAAGLLGTVAASFQFMSAELARLRLSAHADLVLQPNLPWLSLRDLDRVAECVQEGRRTAEEALPAIRRLLASVGGAPSPEPQDSPVALPET
ncbi:MAG: hypothetical protein IRY95_07005, partial [Clostridia bacterium]|nr:hypothetical protein [Clostridia bacterium]